MITVIYTQTNRKEQRIDSSAHVWGKGGEMGAMQARAHSGGSADAHVGGKGPDAVRRGRGC
jgi:hypothetical protein